MRAEIIVSACLAGFNCRYDGDSNPHPLVMALVRLGLAIPVCPEALSGFPTPRQPCEIKNGRVICIDGSDKTAGFEKGAEDALKLAQDCKMAILKSRSPSCGLNQIYDGNFSKKLIPGIGIFARKLLARGCQIWTEADLPDCLKIVFGDNHV